MRGLALVMALCAAAVGRSSAQSVEIGCFADDPLDRVLTDKWSSDMMTPEACENYCISAEKPLYGLQRGDECWCGDCYMLNDGLSKYDRHGSATCSGQPCTGEPSINCGGYYAFSLYQTGDCGAASA